MGIFGMSPALSWFLLGILLVFMELFIPGIVIMFFGIGALLAALTTWIGLTPQPYAQIIVFIISSLLSLFLLRRYLKNIFTGKTIELDSTIKDINIEIGQLVPVIEDIDPDTGAGRVRYQGSMWNASATEKIPAGSSVRIIGKKNITIFVERTEGGGN